MTRFQPIADLTAGKMPWGRKLVISRLQTQIRTSPGGHRTRMGIRARAQREGPSMLGKGERLSHSREIWMGGGKKTNPLVLERIWKKRTYYPDKKRQWIVGLSNWGGGRWKTCPL